ncbi:alpha/beta hydrolase [Nocardia sp. NPDC059091]|uniref:WXG100-like domain-containing protein n=1 Tax=Nocardia sp. NPDC059091 TaxID=3346724 RepID=UPI0036872047
MIPRPPGAGWLGYLAGMKWPDGNEDSLWNMADDWHTHADQLRALGDHIDLAKAAAQTAYPFGDGGEAMIIELEKMRSGNGSIEELAQWMDKIGNSAHGMGTEVEYTKVMFYAALVTLAIDLAAAPLTGPLMGEAEAVAVGAARVAVRFLSKRLLSAAAKKAAESAAAAVTRYTVRHIALNTLIGTATDAGIQAAQMIEGTRDSFNWGQLGFTALTSAAGGAIGGPIGTGIGGALSKPLSKALGNRVGAYTSYAAGGFAGGAVGGGVGGLASLATGGEFDWRTVTGGAIQGAVGGVRHGSMEYARNQAKPVDATAAHPSDLSQLKADPEIHPQQSLSPSEEAKPEITHQGGDPQNPSHPSDALSAKQSSDTAASPLGHQMESPAGSTDHPQHPAGSADNPQSAENNPGRTTPGEPGVQAKVSPTPERSGLPSGTSAGAPSHTDPVSNAPTPVRNEIGPTKPADAPTSMLRPTADLPSAQNVRPHVDPRSALPTEIRSGGSEPPSQTPLQARHTGADAAPTSPRDPHGGTDRTVQPVSDPADSRNAKPANPVGAPAVVPVETNRPMARIGGRPDPENAQTRPNRPTPDADMAHLEPGSETAPHGQAPRDTNRAVLPEDSPVTDRERALAQEALDRRGPGTDPESLQHRANADVQRARDTAAANRDWWHSLSPEEQAALVRAHPHEIGNTDGLPAHVRDQANRLSMTRDLADLENRLRTNPLTRWTNHFSNPADYHLFKNLKKTVDALSVTTDLVDRTYTNPADRPPVHVLSYDARTFDGDGRAVVAIGNVDTASSVSWHVPGITTTVRSLETNLNNAFNHYQSTTEHLADNPRPDNPTLASIAWIGYDAPSGFPKIVREMTDPSLAAAGGKLLARDIAAFNQTRELNAENPSGHPPPDNHIFGHSFGSTTTAHAGEGGRLSGEVTTITLLGSPGAGPITHASDFGIGAENVFVAASPRDPVTFVGSGAHGIPTRLAPALKLGHGIDPSIEAFGARRITAQLDAHGPLQLASKVFSHSDYYRRITVFDEAIGAHVEVPSESLANFSRIAAGDTDAVHPEAHRPTNEDPTPRNRTLGALPNDPASWRPPVYDPRTDQPYQHLGENPVEHHAPDTTPMRAPDHPGNTRNDCGPKALQVLKDMFGSDRVYVPDDPHIADHGMTGHELEDAAGGQLQRFGSHGAIADRLNQLGHWSAALIVDEYHGPTGENDVGAHTYVLINEEGRPTVIDRSIGFGANSLRPDPTGVRATYAVIYDPHGNPVHPIETDADVRHGGAYPESQIGGVRTADPIIDSPDRDPSPQQRVPWDPPTHTDGTPLPEARLTVELGTRVLDLNGQEPLVPNARNVVTDNAGNRLGIFYTDADRNITHVEATVPNMAAGSDPRARPTNLDLANPAPGVVYKLSLGMGNTHTFMGHVPSDHSPSGPRPHAEVPPLHDQAVPPTEPLHNPAQRFDEFTRGETPPAVDWNPPGDHNGVYRTETVRDWDAKELPFSLRDPSENAPHTRYDVYDHEGKWHGTFYTDGNGEPKYIHTWSGNREHGFNPELGTGATWDAGLQVPRPNTTYAVGPRYLEHRGLDPLEPRQLYRTDQHGETIAASIRPHYADPGKTAPEWFGPRRGFDETGKLQTDVGRIAGGVPGPGGTRVHVGEYDKTKFPGMEPKLFRFAGGHLAPFEAGGPGERINHVPQWSYENSGWHLDERPRSNSWRAMEEDQAAIGKLPDARIDRIDIWAERHTPDVHTPDVLNVEYHVSTDSPPATRVFQRSFPNVPEPVRHPAFRAQPPAQSADEE